MARRVFNTDAAVEMYLKEAEPHVPDGHFGDVKIALTYLCGNEMGMLASWFVDLLKRKQLSHFYIDDRVRGKPQTSSYLLGGWSEKVGKRDALRAIANLARAQAGARTNRGKQVRRRNGRGPLKHTYLYVLQGHYAHGWEDLAAEEKQGSGIDLAALRRIRQTRKEYRENEGGSYRIIQRREPR